MNTLDRIEKLIDEYRFKIDDIDVLISSAKEERKYYKSDGPRSNEIRGELAKLNAQRQAYVTFIADLESILDLAPTI